MRMKLRKRILMLLTAALLVMSSLPVVSLAETDDPEKDIRVGFFSMENFMESGRNGAVQSGFTYELLCEIAAYNHWDIEYVYGDFSHLYQQLEEGKIDILPNMIDTEERKEKILFHSFELNTEHYYVSALKSNIPDDETEPAVLNGKRLAAVKDAFEEKYFDEWAQEHGVSMEKVYCKGFDEAWEIVHTIRSITQSSIAAKNIDFFVDVFDVKDEYVICDKLRINQVLLNILSNAIKYTPARGTVSFKASERKSETAGYATYRFSIKDTGIGMSKEFLKTIFDPFTRAKSSTVSGIQGTGLGMSISKNIVDMMGGYETTRRIRALPDPAVANIPIIAMTANAFEEDRQLALAAGMNAHIAKPIDIPTLKKTMDMFL